MTVLVERPVRIPQPDGTTVDGDLVIPAGAEGLVVFAHGSGSSRKSPRNRMVADGLREFGFATLLMDLLTTEEEAIDVQTRHLRFDIGLLAQRLMGATSWLESQATTHGLPLGYFGASTGAAAALVAAARRPAGVVSVVSRGGRPDLAGEALADVQAPTLLIVGGQDDVVLDLNRAAFDRLRVDKRLEVVAGATHLFEEPGALEMVTRLAGGWLSNHFRRTTLRDGIT